MVRSTVVSWFSTNGAVHKINSCFQSAPKLYAIIGSMMCNILDVLAGKSGYKRQSQDGTMESLNTLLATDAVQSDKASAIRDALYAAIVERRLAPGAKLVEAEVSELFNVSRTIVRASLQMLAFEGLVRLERNRGAWVSYPTPEEARQIFDARRMIEPEIAAQAAERMTDAFIGMFREHLAQEELLLAQRGSVARRAAIKASGDYHLLIASVAGNQVLERFMRELVARSSLVIALYGQSGASSCARTEHQEILDALVERNGKKAAEAILHHIAHIEEDLDYSSISNTRLKSILHM
jgi:DNA-binding GntR family transcriptional regulator